LTFVNIKNKLLPGSNISLTEYPEGYNSFTSDQLSVFLSNLTRQVSAFPVYYYATNNIVIELTPDVEGGPIDLAFANWVDGQTAHVMWRFRNENVGDSERLDYQTFEVELQLISRSDFRLEFKIKENSISAIEEWFRTNRYTKPSTGIFQIDMYYNNSGGSSFVRYAMKYSHEPVFTVATPPVISAPLESSYTTPSYTFESLYVPSLTASFVYNFYELNEEDEDAARRKDYSGFKLRDIPRYNFLNWTKAPGDFLTFGEGVSATRVGGITVSDPTSRYSLDTDAVLSGLRTFVSGSTTTSATTASEPEPVELVLGVTFSKYVGYVIVKEKMNKETGEFEPQEAIVINNRNTTQFFDWKVAYSEVYRYKIRTIYQFVNKDGLTLSADSDATLTRSQEASVFGDTRINSYLYYFDGDYSNNYLVECVEFKRPDCPVNFRIFPNSKDRNILLSWCQKNPNRDIKGFNVYRKQINKDSFFLKINDAILDIRNNFFIDYSIDVDEQYVYAVESVDVHENFSSLSLQIKAQIVEYDFEIGRNEQIPELFKLAGGEIIEFEQDDDENKFTFIKNKIQFDINPLFAEYEAGKKFTIKVLSLDTLITKQIKIKFKLTTIYDRGTATSEILAITPDVFEVNPGPLDAPALRINLLGI
jgi:hypothetical protein